jgi:hypothetical protein
LSLERVWPDHAPATPEELVVSRGTVPDGRPLVSAAMVASLDGRAAVAGSSRPLGGEYDLRLMLALRSVATADAELYLRYGG